MTDKRQKATRIVYAMNIIITKESLFVEYNNILLQKKHLSFARARLQMNTTILIKLIRGNIQLNKSFCIWNPMTTRFIM